MQELKERVALLERSLKIASEELAASNTANRELRERVATAEAALEVQRDVQTGKSMYLIYCTVHIVLNELMSLLCLVLVHLYCAVL